ncbi:hypothetical protein LPTSP4_29000 [Leptospira ryugenii]|uniref:Uncharacterized protein n=1 Tax=Leptospira ryugenii TaxID=1917863 RepID=A0A2P2E3G3_9LEPT|nr:hypothetical protein LPTSP4_29000 [Leptospira ryugenii]
MDVAEQKIEIELPNQAFSFLAKAKEIKPELDSRFHNITGNAHWKLGNYYEAISAYEQSIALDGKQNALLLKIADFYDKERKPALALKFTELYLKNAPTDKARLFRAAILSRRSGKEDVYLSYIRLLESDKSFASEEEALQTSLARNLKLKKWKEAEELSLRYLPFFPRVEGMYETLIIARRGKKSPLLEEAYMFACVAFKEETRYFVRYGVYLQEQERYLEALSMFRRAFYQALKYNVQSDWGEFLFLLRQTYTKLGWVEDALAMDVLVSDIKNKMNLRDQDVQNHLNTYRKNREYLLFGVYWFKDKDAILADEYRKLLRERDEETSEKEFLFVIGPFAVDRMEF